MYYRRLPDEGVLFILGSFPVKIYTRGVDLCDLLDTCRSYDDSLGSISAANLSQGAGLWCVQRCARLLRRILQRAARTPTLQAQQLITRDRARCDVELRSCLMIMPDVPICDAVLTGFLLEDKALTPLPRIQSS